MQKKILHLTLKKQWFDEIAAGRKTEEYRECKPYWKARLNQKKHYDIIYFRNGYRRDCPFMIVECKGISINEIWGKDMYIIKLGKILEIRNATQID